MVTAIEHHSNQQGSQYGASSIQTANIGGSRGPKSPSLSSPNGLISPGRSGEGKNKKSKSLSLQTKLQASSHIDVVMSESPRTTLSSPNSAGTSAGHDRSGHTPRGSKRSIDEIHPLGKVGSVPRFRTLSSSIAYRAVMERPFHGHGTDS